MQQGWFQVAGLTLDFLGVMLLAYEWLVGFRAQRREEEAGLRGERELKHLAFAQQSMRDERMAAHYKVVSERARDRIAEEGRAIRHRGTQIRLPVFFTAMVMIATGFVLQALGSWPAGIPALGILPN